MAELVSQFLDRNEAMVAAHSTGAYAYQDIADYSGLHFTTVGRIERKALSSDKA